MHHHQASELHIASSTNDSTMHDPIDRDCGQVYEADKRDEGISMSKLKSKLEAFSIRQS